MRAKVAGWGVLLAVVSALLGVPSADAKALPVETPACGATITHSFRLGADRTCTGDGYITGKDGITIDLNGFTLRGDAGGGEWGIEVDHDDVTIRNGTIRRFDVGIASSFGPSARTTVSRIVAVDNDSIGIVLKAKGSVVKDSVGVANEYGIFMLGANSVVTRNRAINNVSGIVANTVGGVFERNEASGNRERGFWVGGDGQEIARNTVAGNGNGPIARPGIDMQGSSRKNVVAKNLIVGNGDDGYFDFGTKNTVTGNTAHGNGFHAAVSNGSGTGIDANSATQPKGSGNRSVGNDATTPCVPASFCKASPGKKDLPKFTPPCGATVTSSFRLATDMNCSGNGLVLGEGDDITIDLAGHTIRGDGDFVDTGIDIGSVDGVTIRNGAVREFGNGVKTSTAEGVVIKDVVAVQHEVRGFLIAGTGSTVRKNTAVANGSDGASFTGTGHLVSLNRFSNNVDGGIRTDGDGGHSFTGNLSAGNGDFGFRTGAAHNLLEANVFTGNAEHGIVLAGGSHSTSTHENVLVGNSLDGYLDTGAANNVTDNVAYGNGYVAGASDDVGAGIDASGAPFVEGSGNVARGNDAIDQCEPAQLCA